MDIVGENNTLCREVEPRDFGMSGRSERRDLQQDPQQLFKGVKSANFKARIARKAECVPL